MTAHPVRTRFAPSPTGALHAGNARTALFNALLARRAGGVFVLRIEDTDARRSTGATPGADPAAEHGIAEDLRWLGLEWHEGPDAGGAFGPYRQSERDACYRQQYERLGQAGRAYPCFCTPQELEQARAAQRRAGQAPRYPGTCVGLAPDEVRRRIGAGERPALRFRVPERAAVEFDDLVRGAQRFSAADLGDFVIRRADGSPVFFFCNAVDDAMMEITHVLRGEDHLSNTPRQILILEALGLPTPRYGHLPLVVDAAGRPLSKRRGAPSLSALRAAGYLPEAVVNFLARLGHAYEDDALLDAGGLAAGFDPARIGRAPARYEEAQLRRWQRDALARLSDDGVWGWMRAGAGAEALDALVPQPRARDFAATVRGNVEFPADALGWAQRLYADTPSFTAEARDAVCAAGAEFFRGARARLAEPAADFAAFRDGLGRECGLRGRALLLPLRAALTGETRGPELARIWELLGTDGVRRRFDAALALCTS